MNNGQCHSGIDAAKLGDAHWADKITDCYKIGKRIKKKLREYPKLGDRLDNYHIDRETGAWHTTPSHWVVWRVEVFNSADENQVMREGASSFGRFTISEKM